jgi:NADPH-dependent 7-cyano-7-deazaguanine reductase QueF
VNLTAPCAAQVTVTYTGPLTHRCPFVDEVDNGTTTITWTTAGATLELHALAAWLAQFDELVVSHEDLTARIRTELADQEGIADVAVRTAWTTAGAEVTVGCCTSPTPAPHRCVTP